jgi:hypothetical protein
MATSVILLRTNWNKTSTGEATTGTKTFIEASYFPLLTPVDLPELGDSWDDTLIGLKAIGISEGLISENCEVKIWTVNYSTTPSTGIIIPPGELVPSSIEMSANYQTYTSNKKESYKWIWPDGVVAEDLKLRKREVTTTMVIHRSIYGETLNDFLLLSAGKVGKINSADTTINGVAFGKELVQYIGCSASETQTESGTKKWLVQLKFVMLIVGTVGGTSVGWQYAYRPDKNTYERPKFVPAAGAALSEDLFLTTDFSELMTIGDTP